MVLAVDIATDLDGRLELEQDGLGHEDFPSPNAEHTDLVVFEGDLFTGPLAADAEQLLEDGVDRVGG